MILMTDYYVRSFVECPSYTLQNEWTLAQLHVLEQFCRYLVGVIVTYLEYFMLF